ncbi:MAG: acylphosphatase [Terriglobales bacterium]
MARAVQFIVWGEVQGVGFRAFAARQAAALGISGWVRNREDGAVEALAVGPAAALEQFRQALERGPAAARVRRVEMTAAGAPPPKTAATRFLIEP